MLCRDLCHSSLQRDRFHRLPPGPPSLGLPQPDRPDPKYPLPPLPLSPPLKTKSGYFGSAYLGSANLVRPIWFGQFWCWPNLAKLSHPPEERKGREEGWAPKGGAPRRVARNFALFSVSRHNFHSFLPSLLRVFSWNFGGVLFRRGLKCARFEFFGCRSHGHRRPPCPTLDAHFSPLHSGDFRNAVPNADLHLIQKPSLRARVGPKIPSSCFLRPCDPQALDVSNSRLSSLFRPRAGCNATGVFQ